MDRSTNKQLSFLKKYIEIGLVESLTLMPKKNQPGVMNT